MYPIRDAFGLMVGSVPFRLSEIFSVVYAFFMLRYKKNSHFGNIDKRTKNIMLLLILNLILTLLVTYSHSESVEMDFFYKYILRNALTIFIIFSVLNINVAYDSKLIVWGMKWNIVLQILFAIIFFGLSMRIFMNHPMSIWDIQTAGYGNVKLPRFAGSSSEAGYLGPLLSIPLYYFMYNYKNNIIWLLACSLLLLVSLSTSNYFIIFLTASAILYKKNRKSFFKILLFGIIGLVLCISITLFFFKDTLFGVILWSNFDKLLGYLSFGAYGSVDWSASDRLEHLAAATGLFVDGNFIDVIFGRGTGAYSFFAMHNTSLLVQTVEEAYNIYLSTLTDRGAVGLVIFIMIYYNIYKMKSDNVMSDALWFGLAIQLVHYMIVGNMWLYYVWQEVLFLIGYEKYLYLKRKQ